MCQKTNSLTFICCAEAAVKAVTGGCDHSSAGWFCCLIVYTVKTWTNLGMLPLKGNDCFVLLPAIIKADYLITSIT